MTTQPRDPDEITIDPEYTRAYQHYLNQGSTPENAAKYAYAWTKRQQALPAAPARKTNHVAHGLLLAFTVLIGGPVAFLVGLGASIGTEQTPGRPGAFWVVLAGWLLVVATQGFIWARAAR